MPRHFRKCRISANPCDIYRPTRKPDLGFSVKGVATSLTYVPKTFFSMIMMLCSMLLLKINSSSKKIMFFNGEFLNAICNQNSTFLLRFIHNIMIVVLFPWTCATVRIHSLSGRILNITTDGKRPYVKAKVNNYRKKFYLTLVHQEYVCREGKNRDTL